MDSILLDTINV